MSENTARSLLRPDRIWMNLFWNIWNYMGNPLTQRNSNMLMRPFFLCAMSLSSFSLFQGWCGQWWMIRRAVQCAHWFQENCCVTSWNTREYQFYILFGVSRVWISVRRPATGVQVCAICFSRWRYWPAWIVPQIRSQLIPSKFFLIHCLPVYIAFDMM